MTSFQVGDRVLVPTLQAVATRTGDIVHPYRYSYEEVIQEGEIVSLFAASPRCRYLQPRLAEAT